MDEEKTFVDKQERAVKMYDRGVITREEFLFELMDITHEECQNVLKAQREGTLVTISPKKNKTCVGSVKVDSIIGDYGHCRDCGRVLHKSVSGKVHEAPKNF